MAQALLNRQITFMRNLPRLIDRAFTLGYEVTGGELYRDQQCPCGSKASKHHDRLAIVLNLFLDGEYLTDAESHRELGEWWEGMGGKWGGRSGDPNRYEWP